MLKLLSMTAYRYFDLLRTDSKTGCWFHGVIAVCVGVCLNYVSAHLATEAHFHDSLSLAAESHSHDQGHAHAHGHDETGSESDHHVPHPVSDHSFNPSVPAQLAIQTFLYSAVLTEPLIVRRETNLVLANPHSERIKLPGASPPGPLQPRAPPIT